MATVVVESIVKQHHDSRVCADAEDPMSKREHPIVCCILNLIQMIHPNRIVDHLIGQQFVPYGHDHIRVHSINRVHLFGMRLFVCLLVLRVIHVLRADESKACQRCQRNRVLRGEKGQYYYIYVIETCSLILEKITHKAGSATFF